MKLKEYRDGNKTKRKREKNHQAGFITGRWAGSCKMLRQKNGLVTLQVDHRLFVQASGGLPTTTKN